MKLFRVTGDTHYMCHGIGEGTVVMLTEDDGTRAKAYTPVDEKHYLYGLSQFIHDNDVEPINT